MRRTIEESGEMESHRGPGKGGPLRRLRDRLLLQEDLNFLLTNRVPRALLTHAMGWLSHVSTRC